MLRPAEYETVQSAKPEACRLGDPIVNTTGGVHRILVSRVVAKILVELVSGGYSWIT